MKHLRKSALVAAAFSLVMSVTFAADTATPAVVTSTPATSGIVNQPDEATGTKAAIIAEETPAVATTPVAATPAQLGIKEVPKILPGSFFYPFKQFAEWLELAFTFDPIAKADKQISLVSERLLEAKLLADLDDTDSEDFQFALDEYQKELDLLKESLVEIDADEEVEAEEVDTDTEEAGVDVADEIDAEVEDAEGLSGLGAKLAETELARQSLFAELLFDDKWDAELEATLEAMQVDSFRQTQDSLVALGGEEAAGEAFLAAFKAFDADWQVANADLLTSIADFNASVAAEVATMQKEILAEAAAMTQGILDEVNAEVNNTIKETNQMTEDILREVNAEVGNSLENTNKMVNDIQREIDADLQKTLNETQATTKEALGSASRALRNVKDINLNSASEVEVEEADASSTN